MYLFVEGQPSASASSTGQLCRAEKERAAHLKAKIVSALCAHFEM